MVDHTFLFSGPVTKIRELVDSGTLGALYYFDSTRVNLGLFQHDVNVIWDLAPHDLSIMDHIILEKPEAVVATGGKHLNGLADVAFITIYFPRNVIAHVNVNWLSPVKVRTTLIGGEQKMLVWNDLDPDEKIKVYDKGVKITNKEGLHELLVSYRSGDVWAPKIEQTEALEGGARVLHRLHRERSDADQRRRGRLAGRQAARGGRQVPERKRQPCRPLRAPIPFLDLVTPHLELEEELLSVFRGALRTGGFVGGPAVEGFEQRFAEFCDVPHAVGVASGTDALLFALLAAGVKPGDTVVTVPNTFIATTEAIRQAGAQPDFVDVDERTYTMDPVKLLRYLESECTRGPNGQVVSRRTGGPGDGRRARASLRTDG